MRNAGGKQWLGAALLLALPAHAWSLGRPNLPHMLWSCHVASAVLAVGILSNSRPAVAAGFLFHLGIGFPAWLIEMIVTKGTFGSPVLVGHILVTSTLVHVLPLIAGGIVLHPLRHELPRSSILFAWAIQLGMLPISRWLTPPPLNVNLAHAVWTPLHKSFPRLWVFHLAISAACLGTLLISYVGLRFLQREGRAG